MINSHSKTDVFPKTIKDIKSEKLKVKTLFCDKDLSSVKIMNLLSKTHACITNDKFV